MRTIDSESDVPGTNCSLLTDCESCSENVRCSYCQTDTTGNWFLRQSDPNCFIGYCFGSTLFASSVCTSLNGQFKPSCGKSNHLHIERKSQFHFKFYSKFIGSTTSSGTTGIPTTSGGSTTGSTINTYAKVDPNAHCEDFQGTQCIGTVFYNGNAHMVRY